MTAITRERPIIFSGPMVRAILDGRKTVTRRIVKPQPDDVIDSEPYWNVGGFMAEHYRPIKPNRPGREKSLRCPYGDRGDRLWVKETLRLRRAYEDIGTGGPVLGIYAADDAPIVARQTTPHQFCGRAMFDVDVPCGVTRTSPPIFMPRWASRLTLEVVSVRVERLQEITVDEIAREGIEMPVGTYPQCMNLQAEALLREFIDGWQILHGAGSWESNPWVWRIEFRRAAS